MRCAILSTRTRRHQGLLHGSMTQVSAKRTADRPEWGSPREHYPEKYIDNNTNIRIIRTRASVMIVSDSGPGIHPDEAK